MNKFPKNKQTFNEIIAQSKLEAKKNTENLVKFSFKYLTNVNPKFDYNGCASAYFLAFLERLKSVSSMTISAFLNDRNKGLRAHVIDWSDTTEGSFDIKGEEQLVDTPYQFSLSSNEHGRVHGFVLGNRFYIVWLDKDHKLYK